MEAQNSPNVGILNDNNKQSQVSIQDTSLTIRSIKINDIFFRSKGKNLILKSDDDDVEFYFAVPPDSLCCYQLEPFDKSPKHILGNAIRYTNLSGGDYHLFVWSKNRPSQKNTYNIEVEYTMFEEAWFKYSFIFYILLLVIAVFYLIKLYDQRQKKQIISLKNKLVSDLHDDIGSSLTSIIVFTKLLKREKSISDNVTEISNDILETAQDSIENLRNIVSVLNPNNDDFCNLIEKFNLYTRKLLNARDIQVLFEVLPDNSWLEQYRNKNLDVKLNLNVFFIFREIINNIIKHAQATTVKIEVKNEEDCIVIKIKDNGKGFDTKVRYNGMGMTTLRQRTKDCFIQLNIFSALEEGTTVTLKIPTV